MKEDQDGARRAGLAHTLKNILQLILPALSLRRAADDDAKRQEADDLIERSLHRARELLDDAAGAPRARIAQATANVAALVRPTLPPGVRLSIDAPLDLPPVAVPGIVLEETLLDLISNSLHALEGRGAISVTARPARALRADGAPGELVQLTVADTGPGIPPALRERIFDAGFSAKPVGQGHGIGLANARAELEKHGGKLLLDTPVRGAQFSLYLPLAH